ncbi:MAG: hypothetical protein EOQ39_09200 [Mesorhizobium sp.]|nr:MAG: hypothetical protein EOQ37_10305 [Mesorhizobium sp.]RWB15930.1 MAG: hypothetical protein EOQ39_09200 [Mesorhizobium sp.]RWO67679.1 MAG: hypothetical protein EOS17_17750 [Mesorhizobium sp.]
MPLSVAIARAGSPVFQLRHRNPEGREPEQRPILLEAVTSTALADRAVSRHCGFVELAVCDAIIICVPTPLTKHRKPRRIRCCRRGNRPRRDRLSGDR